MTAKIDRESLLPFSPEGFKALVESHVVALNEYSEHLKRVDEDATNPDIPADEKRVAFPGPRANPLVESAIRLDGRTAVADYELVGPSLEVRKQRLFAKVSEAEQAELTKITPPAKQRYFDLREQEINVRGAQGASLEELGFIIAQKERRRKQAAVALWAAKHHHDIEDLTEQTVDGWELTTFNG